MKLHKITAGLLSILIMCAAAAPAFAATMGTETSPQVVKVNYSDIENIVRSSNQTIRSNNKMLDSLNSNDAAEEKLDEIAESSAELQDVNNQLQSAYNAVASLPASTEQKGLAASLQGSIASITAIRSIMGSEGNQLSVSQDTIDKTEMQTDAAADQIVVAAQKLYVTFRYLDAERTSLLKQQQFLNDTLNITQLQADLGLITQDDLLNAQQQKNTLAGSISTLVNQMRTVKNNFQVLLGYSTDYDVSMLSMPEPDENFAASMNEETDLQTAQDTNWAVKEKDLGKEIANGNKDPDLDSTVDDYRAAVLNDSLARNKFKASFQQVYNDVAEKRELFLSAQSLCGAKSKTRDAVKRRNELGAASAIDLKRAQMDLDSAQSAFEQAKIDLFSSQEQYRWALRGVIGTDSSQN